MPKIARHHPEIHLPLFAWAEDCRRMDTDSAKGYRVGPRLDVHPIWGEVRA